MKYVVQAAVSGILQFVVYFYLLWGRSWFEWVGVFIALCISNIIVSSLEKKNDALKKENNIMLKDLENKISKAGIKL